MKQVAENKTVVELPGAGLASPAPACVKTTILIVDDEPHVRDILARYLTPAGHECTKASDGDEAWGMLLKRPFSLLITDMIMPGMSGTTLLSMVRRRLGVLPVIVLSVMDDAATAAFAKRLGADSYITKPFDKDKVLATVARVLERRQASPAG